MYNESNTSGVEELQRPPIRKGYAIPREAARALTAIADKYETYCLYPEKKCPKRRLDDVCTLGDCPENMGKRRKIK